MWNEVNIEVNPDYLEHYLYCLFFAVCFWIKQRKRNITLCNKNKSKYAVKNVKSTEIGRRSIVSNKQKKQKTKDCC